MSIDKNIEREGPFKDLFEERQIFGENFIKFIESIDSADNTNFLNVDEREITRVISIDAEWGFGKTTFLNALEKALILKDFIVFKFNAWENDLEKEPLSAFVRVLLPQIIHATGQNFEDIIKYKRKMSNFIAATNTIITQTTKFLPIITETDILKIIEDTKKNTKYLMEQESETIKCGMSKSDEMSLKNDFINSLNAISPPNNKKIIVLIDELDRCNPTFAIELLERIKHFFDTEKYLFIFTINSTQLKSSVKQIYGEGFQETGYFRRFFDYEFYLPEPDKYQYLSDKLSIINTNDTFHKYILYYFHNQNISLRDCNKIINFIQVIKTQIPNNTQSQSYIAFGILIRFIDKKFFEMVYIKNKITNQFLESIEFQHTESKLHQSLNFYESTTAGKETPRNTVSLKYWILAFIESYQNSEYSLKKNIFKFYSIKTKIGKDTIKDNFTVYKISTTVSSNIYGINVNKTKLDQLLSFGATLFDN